MGSKQATEMIEKYPLWESGNEIAAVFMDLTGVVCRVDKKVFDKKG